MHTFALDVRLDYTRSQDLVVNEPARKVTASQQTREELILAAERLFSESGIDAVSLRQINAAAGQRNSSAAHYHFGSKDALIAATFDYRMERINGRRLRKLDEISKAGKTDDVRTLVGAIIFPIVEEIEESEGGSNYIRFEGQSGDNVLTMVAPSSSHRKT